MYNTHVINSSAYIHIRKNTMNDINLSLNTRSMHNCYKINRIMLLIYTGSRLALVIHDTTAMNRIFTNQPNLCYCNYFRILKFIDNKSVPLLQLKSKLSKNK